MDFIKVFSVLCVGVLAGSSLNFGLKDFIGRRPLGRDASTFDIVKSKLQSMVSVTSGIIALVLFILFCLYLKGI